jgi:hypothetical protein
MRTPSRVRALVLQINRLYSDRRDYELTILVPVLLAAAALVSAAV